MAIILSIILIPSSFADLKKYLCSKVHALLRCIAHAWAAACSLKCACFVCLLQHWSTEQLRAERHAVKLKTLTNRSWYLFSRHLSTVDIAYCTNLDINFLRRKVREFTKSDTFLFPYLSAQIRTFPTKYVCLALPFPSILAQFPWNHVRTRWKGGLDRQPADYLIHDFLNDERSTL
jgi:hypothetical protein